MFSCASATSHFSQGDVGYPTHPTRTLRFSCGSYGVLIMLSLPKSPITCGMKAEGVAPPFPPLHGGLVCTSMNTIGFRV